MDGILEICIAALIGSASGGGVVGIIAKFALDRAAKRWDAMEVELANIKRQQIGALDERLDDVEEDVEEVRTHCKGAANLERIQALEKRAERAEFQTSDLVRKMEGVQVTLTNQASAFRDFSLKLDRFMECVAGTTAKLQAVDGCVQEVAHEARAHHADHRRHANG